MLQLLQSSLTKATSSKEIRQLVDVDSSSHPEVFCKKGVPINFAKFSAKNLCESLFLIKLQA